MRKVICLIACIASFLSVRSQTVEEQCCLTIQEVRDYRNSDEKRLHVIANLEPPQFKYFLNNQVFFEKKDEVNEEYRNNLPMPKYEPYLIQSGVRFIYQKYEIASGAAEVVKGDVSFSEIRQFLSDEVKRVLK